MNQTNSNIYLDRLGRQRVYIAVFDRLSTDPRGLAKDLFRFLDLPRKVCL